MGPTPVFPFPALARREKNSPPPVNKKRRETKGAREKGDALGFSNFLFSNFWNFGFGPPKTLIFTPAEVTKIPSISRIFLVIRFCEFTRGNFFGRGV
jgi:hypothetical protein